MPKLNSEAVVAHYRALAEALDMEIVVQDYPPVSGYTIEAALLARIAREVPKARTIKLEDPPTPLKTAQIRREAGSTPLAILGGLGGVYVFEELLAAADAFHRFVPLMRFEFQPGIGVAIRKELLRRRGALESAAIRAPGAMLDASTRLALDHLLRRHIAETTGAAAS